MNNARSARSCTAWEKKQKKFSILHVFQKETRRNINKQFDAYFQIRQNVIYERARFKRRIQQPGELVNQFITEIHKLVESCNFGEMKEELIHDCLIVGIRDDALSEHLQLEPDLTLDKVKRLICQRESVKIQDILQKTLQRKTICWMQ